MDSHFKPEYWTSKKDISRKKISQILKLIYSFIYLNTLFLVNQYQATGIYFPSYFK